MPEEHLPSRSLRQRLHEVIVEADTPAGRTCDTVVPAPIVASVMVVLLTSVSSIRARFSVALATLE